MAGAQTAVAMSPLEAAVEQLLRSQEFATAVLSQNVRSAAAAAATLTAQQAAAAPVQQAAQSEDAARLKHSHSAASSSGMAFAPEYFRVGERLVVQSTSSSCQQQQQQQQLAVGAKECVVVGVAPDGLLTLRVTGPASVPLLQQRTPAAVGQDNILGGNLPRLKVPAMRGGVGPGGGAGGGSATSAASAVHKARAVVQRLRDDMLLLEQKVPWAAVKRSWRAKRNSWRKSSKTADSLSELAARIHEFFMALATEEVSFPGCGASWRASLDCCRLSTPEEPHGASLPLLQSLWDEFRTALGHWMDARNRPLPAFSAEQLQRQAARGVAALQQAALEGPDAVTQVPLECIVQHERQGLSMVRGALEAQRYGFNNNNGDNNGAGAGGNCGGSGPDVLLLMPSPPPPPGPPPPGYGLWVTALEVLDDFDSGAETEVEDNSEVTVMSDSD